jgi:glycosyltransferase involved in cell wall biosynthesis
MKILVVQDRLRSGGTERQSILFTRAFLAAGHDAALLTFRPGGALDSSAGELPRSALQNLDTRLDWFAPGLRARVRAFAPDVVLCMGRMANCHAGAIARLLRKQFPRSVVIGTMRTGKNLPWLFRRALRRVHHIVANSHRSKALLIDRYAVAAEKISVIHNSLVFAPHDDAAVIARDRAELRQRFGATGRTRVLLCVAMFRPEKNQRELIELFSQLPTDADCQLWLGGEGPARAECEALVAQKNLTARVKFTGFKNDPRPLYRAADIAVLTSASESLSNFLVEAHAHGVPSVAYDVSGVSECGGTVVRFGDQPAFLAALAPLLTDPAARAAEAARVRAYADVHFAPDRQIAAYLDLFDRLLSPPRP